MTNEPPRDAFFCRHVSTCLMFGEGAISSSESPTPSARGVPKPGVPKTILPFRTLWIGERLLPMCCPGLYPPAIEAVRGFLVEATLVGVGGNGSTIWQSKGDDDKAWVIGALPLSGVASQSKVECLTEVRVWSEVLPGTRDCPCPDLTDTAFFRLTWEERVISRAFPKLAGREPPPCWLGPTAIGGFWTNATSPTTS